jgi:hypothetical protein
MAGTGVGGTICAGTIGAVGWTTVIVDGLNFNPAAVITISNIAIAAYQRILGRVEPITSRAAV